MPKNLLCVAEYIEPGPAQPVSVVTSTKFPDSSLRKDSVDTITESTIFSELIFAV